VDTPHLNWIADNSRAPGPPAWFLKAMWDMDAELVILPSRVRRAYVVARRRMKSATVPMLVKSDNELQRKTRGTDADMLQEHNLIFIDWITGNLHGNWSLNILADLKDRDTWAAGGGEKYVDKLEAQEQKVAADRRTAMIDDLGHRAADAWRSLQARTGKRNQHSNAFHKKSRAKVLKGGKLAPLPSSSTAGSGLSVQVGFVADR